MKIIRNFILICSTLIVVAGICLPKSASAITVQEEEDLSREFMKVVLSHYSLIKDPLIVNYINEVGQKILSFLPPQPFSYHFYVIKEDTYNAFAIPAGHIFINSGLMEAMDDEEELAGILSHEIAHVVCRHISQKLERAKKINVVTLAGLVAGIFLGAGGSAAVANAVTAGSVAAGQSMALAYSREDERQADQIGLSLLSRAGYSGKGMLPILKKLRGKRWFGTEQIPTYVQTHPGVEERMAYIDTWLEKHKTTTNKIDPYPFARAHIKLVALYGDEKTVFQTFKSAVENHSGGPLVHYGYGLVLDRRGDRKEAAEQLKTALEKKAFDPFILKDLGRIYFFDGRYQEAFNILQGVASIASNDPEIRFYLGRTQVALGRLDAATATFEALIEKKYDDPRVFYSLGETYGKLGKLGYAHYYLGIYYHKKNDFKNAGFHLKRALEKMDDPDKKSDIEKILKEIKEKKHRTKKIQ